MVSSFYVDKLGSLFVMICQEFDKISSLSVMYLSTWLHGDTVIKRTEFCKSLTYYDVDFMVYVIDLTFLKYTL